MEIWIPAITFAASGVLGTVLAAVRACHNRAMVMKALEELREARSVEVSLTRSSLRVRAGRDQGRSDS